jgi:RNA polymerase sigma-70 factor (ECF subfamily)
LKFAYKLTKSKDEAKDLYQETAYRALRNKGKFQENTNLKAWLCTIMRNIFINNYRRNKKKNTMLDATDNQFFLNTAGPTVVNNANSSLIMKEIQDVIDRLDVGISEPFMLHYYGYKYHEIAEQLELPLGTVKSRIFFARKELKVALLENYKDLAEYIA